MTTQEKIKIIEDFISLTNPLIHRLPIENIIKCFDEEEDNPELIIDFIKSKQIKNYYYNIFDTSSECFKYLKASGIDDIWPDILIVEFLSSFRGYIRNNYLKEYLITTTKNLLDKVNELQLNKKIVLATDYAKNLYDLIETFYKDRAFGIMLKYDLYENLRKTDLYSELDEKFTTSTEDEIKQLTEVILTSKSPELNRYSNKMVIASVNINLTKEMRKEYFIKYYKTSEDKYLINAFLSTHKGKEYQILLDIFDEFLPNISRYKDIENYEKKINNLLSYLIEVGCNLKKDNYNYVIKLFNDLKHTKYQNNILTLLQEKISLSFQTYEYNSYCEKSSFTLLGAMFNAIRGDKFNTVDNILEYFREFIDYFGKSKTHAEVLRTLKNYSGYRTHKKISIPECFVANFLFSNKITYICPNFDSFTDEKKDNYVSNTLEFRTNLIYNIINKLITDNEYYNFAVLLFKAYITVFGLGEINVTRYYYNRIESYAPVQISLILHEPLFIDLINKIVENDPLKHFRTLTKMNHENLIVFLFNYNFNNSDIFKGRYGMIENSSNDEYPIFYPIFEAIAAKKLKLLFNIDIYNSLAIINRCSLEHFKYDKIINVRQRNTYTEIFKEIYRFHFSEIPNSSAYFQYLLLAKFIGENTTINNIIDTEYLNCKDIIITEMHSYRNNSIEYATSVLYNEFEKEFVKDAYLEYLIKVIIEPLITEDNLDVLAEICKTYKTEQSGFDALKKVLKTMYLDETSKYLLDKFNSVEYKDILNKYTYNYLESYFQNYDGYFNIKYLS